MSIENIFPKVQAIIADVLVVEESDVTLNKRLIADLGAESIDFLDLVFQLEREFKVKIPRGQIEKEVRGSLSDNEFENSGVVSAKGLQALKDYLSEVPAEYFKENLKVAEIPTLFTVETLCKLVLNAKTRTEGESQVTSSHATA